MKALTRRGILGVAAGAAVVGLAACGNGVGSNGGAQIDARVDSTLSYMYQNYPGTEDLASRAAGMLVMPVVTEAGLGFGGAYGRGALRVGDVTVDYYNQTKASFGIQIGAQQYAHVIFFMTDAALMDFRTSEGWTAGADVKYAVPTEGQRLTADTLTTTRPVIAVVFGQAGLTIGATIEGSKYSRIIP